MVNSCLEGLAFSMFHVNKYLGGHAWYFLRRNTHIEMFPSARSAATVLLVLAAPTFAQLQPESAGLKVLKSRFGDGVTVTYKEVRTQDNKLMHIPEGLL